MNIFRTIVFSAILVGLSVGFFISLVQQFTTAPLIAQAEVYERAGESAGHDMAPMAAVSESHDHDEEAWSPADGWERTAYSVLANVLTATGYALVLTGLLSFTRRPIDWRTGLLWGLAGFITVNVAPGIGLPPELPGTPAGPLLDRQLWWIGTALATASALGLIAYIRKPWAGGLAVALIALPHLIGAPVAPSGEHALAPEALSRQFIVAVTVSGLVFWALLGSLSAAFYRRFAA